MIKLALLILAASIGMADAKPMKPASSWRIIDGDTIQVNRKGGAIVRVIGYDTPEIHNNPEHGYQCKEELEKGLLARDALQSLLAPPHRVGIFYKRTKAGKIYLDRYGRRLALIIRSDGKDVSDVLIAAGLAHPYDGRGKKPGWCP